MADQAPAPPLSPEMLQQLANIPAGDPSSMPASVPAKGSFLGEVRQLPVKLNQRFDELVSHYWNDPKYKGVPEAKKADLVQTRAGHDAYIETLKEFQQVKKQYNVKAFTPDILRQSITQDKSAYEPDSRAQLLAAQHGEDAKQIYLKERMPNEVAGEFGTLDPYAQHFYDQPQKQMPQQPVRPRPAPVIEQAPAPQTDTQGTAISGENSPANPVVPPRGMPGNDARPMYAPGTENT